MKGKKFLFASILVAIFLLTVGLTYAYFSQTISGNEEAYYTLGWQKLYNEIQKEELVIVCIYNKLI